MTKSVVVVSYRRLERLNQILAAWLKETNDVWICDCSGGRFHTSLPVKKISASPDPGNRIRHAVALMTSNELIIKADDDVMPKAGIANDFEKYFLQTGPAILGIHGRIFNGPDYYRDTSLHGGKNVSEPKRVDFVGVVTCSPRQFLPMDLRGCESGIEDLFWQMKKYPDAPKYIIPTDKFHHLEESKDKLRLCGTPESRMLRKSFYTRWYNRNYANKRATA